MRNFFDNRILIVAIIANLIAQGLKVIIHYIREKEWDFKLLLSTGGIPSSHCATVAALTFLIGYYEGITSPFFTISLIFSSIVIIDAMSLRKEVGRHSKTLNSVFDELNLGEKIGYKEFEERVGHTKIEVFWGIILGIAVSLLFIETRFLAMR